MADRLKKEEDAKRIRIAAKRLAAALGLKELKLYPEDSYYPANVYFDDEGGSSHFLEAKITCRDGPWGFFNGRELLDYWLNLRKLRSLRRLPAMHRLFVVATTDDQLHAIDVCNPELDKIKPDVIHRKKRSPALNAPHDRELGLNVPLNLFKELTWQ